MSIGTIILMILWAGIAVVCHEAGHWCAARWLGYQPRPVVTWKGPGIRWDATGAPDEHHAIVAASGPLASVLLVAVAFAVGLGWLAACSTELAVVNLIPFRNSDGRHLWAAHHRKERLT